MSASAKAKRMVTRAITLSIQQRTRSFMPSSARGYTLGNANRDRLALNRKTMRAMAQLLDYIAALESAAAPLGGPET